MSVDDRGGGTPARIERVFSDGLRERLGGSAGISIGNVDPELRELVVAGALGLGRSSIIWVVGENEDFTEREARLRGWCEFLGIDPGPVFIYKRPFQDPYVNQGEDLSALRGKLRLIEGLKPGGRSLVVTTLSALSVRLEEPGAWPEISLTIRTAEPQDRNRFISRVQDMGYRVRDFVEGPGDMSWRGSIVDVFPVTVDFPLRIEFAAGRVASLRSFDLKTQKSISGHEAARISQSRFFRRHHTLADYLKGDKAAMVHLPEIVGDCRFFVNDMNRIDAEHSTLLRDYNHLFRMAKKGDPDLPPIGEVFDFTLDPSRTISLDEEYDEVSCPIELKKERKCLLEFTREDIDTVGRRVQLEGLSGTICSRKTDVLSELPEAWAGFTRLALHIPHSFENTVTRSLFITFRPYRSRDESPRIDTDPAVYDPEVKKIHFGDLVVHKQHGIGRFVGIKWLEIGEHASEFLQVAYKGNEYLYVPVYELDVLEKYVAFEGIAPPLDRLGGKSWAVKQARARKSIVQFARELLELYAMRRSIRGNAYPRVPDLESRLQDEFRYVETEDQKRAIRDVLVDLESDHPMDRLLCGDVSFGKTEVAIRAALRVLSNGKQVALLCPTTILAMQHHQTFKTRFEPFPLQVALLSRMVPTAERQRIRRDLGEGRVDMVIGTHSLLSKDVEFKDLGLYIIDEEQRFGVFQKEKLKRGREDVDVLSLTATPIPRTLSLSLAGLQDLSIIQSPPIGRLAIKNFVGRYTKEMIISAVLAEMERDGLVYIVCSTIERLYAFMEECTSWLPAVPLSAIHAQMPTATIEKNLLGFIHKESRVLVSTTIIENGIDIPDVNTLIVIDADRFGLTQLYQLRGRIGRGNRQAFAFFLVRSTSIHDRARSRLQAIRDFADLGSGYKLAEFDMKLRGMGSLLGNRQHGHIEALGFDYYLELLNRTVKELKGEEEMAWESRIHIHFPYIIATEYIENTSERLRYYKRILETSRLDDLLELRRELLDRFGPFPAEFERVFLVALVRWLARIWRFPEVDVFEHRVLAVPPDDGLPGQHPCLSLFSPLPEDQGISGKLVLEWERFEDLLNLCRGIFSTGGERL